MFTVRVLNKCNINLIKASIVPDIDYIIGSPVKSITINKWSMNITQCGPMKGYLALLANGAALPSFIVFKETTMALTV